jgi:hypothetical protein
MRIRKDQILKFDRKINRDMELENSNGWVSKHSIHSSKKTYNRTKKHKNEGYKS